MQVKVLMPRMGQSMEEGSVSRWLVKVGDRVKKDDALAEIETDKAVVNLESSSDGIVEEILVPIGKIVPVGQPLAVIENGKSDNSGAEQNVKEVRVEAVLKPGLVDEVEKKLSVRYSTDRINASPAAKAYAQSTGIDLNKIPLTNPRGFITKANIEDFIKLNASGQTTDLKPSRVNTSPLAKKLADELGLDMSKITGTGEGGRITKEDVNEFHNKLNQRESLLRSTDNTPSVLPLSKIKQKIAERMKASKDTIPHFYVSIDLDITQALSLRESLNNHGEDISVNDLIIRAVVVTLKKYPNLNALYMDDKIHQYPHVDMAMAVSSENSLLTPVISNCEELSLVELSHATRSLVARTRSGSLTADDLKMGTFTISNLGMYGIKDFSAIINPPQVAILAVGMIQKLPRFDEFDKVVVSHMINLTLSADHRAVDGVEVSKYLRDLKKLLEDGFPLGESG
jgi:pyruvate dehydrogenase E2 component (dihydrolipoamide acetyltransferase)